MRSVAKKVAFSHRENIDKLLQHFVGYASRINELCRIPRNAASRQFFQFHLKLALFFGREQQAGSILYDFGQMKEFDIRQGIARSGGFVLVYHGLHSTLFRQ
jgi:hypothetical protein